MFAGKSQNCFILKSENKFYILSCNGKFKFILFLLIQISLFFIVIICTRITQKKHMHFSYFPFANDQRSYMLKMNKPINYKCIIYYVSLTYYSITHQKCSTSSFRFCYIVDYYDHWLIHIKKKKLIGLFINIILNLTEANIYRT